MTSSQPQTLLAAVQTVLNSPAPAEKVAAAAYADQLRLGNAPLGDFALRPPERPARPSKPALVAPSEVPRRRLGSPHGRAALLHAIAHIEFNAIDLAFDMALRFSAAIADHKLDAAAFAADWVRIGGEEARHFSMIARRLSALESQYGTFPAHNGLWEAADNTRRDVLSRLAIAPLILEARGLDVTPEMIERLRAVGDEESVSVLEIIYREEVGHVACGKRWFDAICQIRGLEPTEAFHAMREKYFNGQVKPPFNHYAREQAGMSRAFYEPEQDESRN